MQYDFNRDVWALSSQQLLERYPQVVITVQPAVTDKITPPRGQCWVCDCGCGIVTPGYFTVAARTLVNRDGEVLECDIELGIASPCINKKNGEHYAVELMAD